MNSMMNSFGLNYNSWGGSLGFFAPFAFLVPLIGLAFLVFEIYMLVDAIKHQKDTHLIVWVLVILMINPIGSILYFFMEKQKRVGRG